NRFFYSRLFRLFNLLFFYVLVRNDSFSRLVILRLRFFRFRRNFILDGFFRMFLFYWFFNMLWFRLRFFNLLFLDVFFREYFFTRSVS
ncbi:MAG: hypothetical protein II114_08605, partial [Treponema sp.]|nr:hypothetical protein [Treponema sp.]